LKKAVKKSRSGVQRPVVSMKEVIPVMSTRLSQADAA
jgi:hypothetical protein